MKKLAMPATSSMIAPMNSHLPIAVRSRLMIDDSDAMPRKMAPVPAKAIMIRLAPLARPSTEPTSRDSIRPMKKVKPSSTGTPAAEFFVFSMANISPNAPTKNTIMLMPGDIAARQTGGHADPRAQHGGHHRQREQPIGIAQDSVTRFGQRAGADVTGSGLQARVHAVNLHGSS